LGKEHNLKNSSLF